jgi:hypothetical protein
MNTIFRRLLYVLRRSRYDADLREEIATHRALRQDALQRDGLTSDEAVRAGRRALGNVELAVEDARDVWLPVSSTTCGRMSGSQFEGCARARASRL